MANRLSYNDLLKYMEIVLDMEKNIYIEQQTLKQLQNQANRLGIARSYKEPKAEENRLNALAILGIIWLSILLGVIVYAVLRIGSFILTLAMHPLEPAVCLVVGGVISILSIFISIGIAVGNQLNNEESYRYELNEYNQAVFNDSIRVQNELQKRQYIFSRRKLYW